LTETLVAITFKFQTADWTGRVRPDRPIFLFGTKRKRRRTWKAYEIKAGYRTPYLLAVRTAGDPAKSGDRLGGPGQWVRWLYYDRNDHSWSQSQYGFGVQCPYKKHLMFDTYTASSELYRLQPKSRERDRSYAQPLFQTTSIISIAHVRMKILSRCWRHGLEMLMPIGSALVMSVPAGIT
jgi:hypothetical protein